MYRFKCKKALIVLCILAFCMLLNNNCYAEELELEKSSINYQEGGTDTIVTNVSEAAIGKYSYNKIPSILDDLIGYIQYNAGISEESKVYSIFDVLFSQKCCNVFYNFDNISKYVY